ncbi:hypothetical protein KSS87_004931 [Heliosperma pusillum]|nr:hypothetical protein KSS87_004931 [Heliosperma pusillum]
MKQGRLIVHTTSYNITKGNEARKTHCTHKELQFNNGKTHCSHKELQCNNG